MSPSRLVPVAVLLTAGLAACGAKGGGDATTPAAGARPVTIENCGAEVSFDRTPERVVLLGPAVPFLVELGVLDRVTARAGHFPPAYFDEETGADLDQIPVLTDELDTSGHLQISKETVISQEPDLVLGQTDTLSRETLAAVGIPLIEEPAMCEQGLDEPGFDDVYDQLEVYGKVFDREAQAREAIAGLKADLAAVESRVDADESRTAAVLYPTVGGGPTYAYGTKSMAHPQLEAAGFRNVFANVDERVFEVGLEELLGRDPDVLILLHSDGDAAEVEAAVTRLPGAEELTAVRNGDVLAQLFNFTEPPTPLSIAGLERIVERFGSER